MRATFESADYPSADPISSQVESVLRDAVNKRRLLHNQNYRFIKQRFQFHFPAGEKIDYIFDFASPRRIMPK